MTDHTDPVPSGRRRWIRVAFRGGLALAIVVGIFVGVLPQLADLDAALTSMVSLPALEAATLVALAAGVLAATWIALSRLIEGANLTEAGVAHVLSTAVANTVPAGGAVAVGVNVGVHTSYGQRTADVLTGLVTMGLLDNAVKLGLPVVLVALSPLLPEAQQLPAAAAVTALVVGIVAAALVLALTREPLVGRLADGAQRLVRRWRPAASRDEPAWSAEAVDQLRRLQRRLRRHGMVAGLAVVATHVLQIVLLVVALRSLGVPAEHAGVVRVTVVYTLMRLVTAVPVTPGGLGIAELGLVAGLRVGAPPGSDEAIVAAALLFRVLTFLLPVVLAAPSWLVWRWHRRGAERR